MRLSEPWVTGKRTCEFTSFLRVPNDIHPHDLYWTTVWMLINNVNNGHSWLIPLKLMKVLPVHWHGIISQIAQQYFTYCINIGVLFSCSLWRGGVCDRYEMAVIRCYWGRALITSGREAKGNIGWDWFMSTLSGLSALRNETSAKLLISCVSQWKSDETGESRWILSPLPRGWYKGW